MLLFPQQGIRCKLRENKKDAEWSKRFSKGVASRIPEDGAMRLSEVGAIDFLQDGVIVFSLAGVCFSQKKWLLHYGVIS